MTKKSIKKAILLKFCRKMLEFGKDFVILQMHCGENWTPSGVTAILQDIVGKRIVSIILMRFTLK